MLRTEQIDSLNGAQFDLCIIGGGITAAGIADHAVRRGLKTVLLEKNDFASGTSSKSSKMIHGGLRYLKMAQFGLVREALLEREYLLKRFPGLVRPLPFIMPSYHSKADLWLKALVIRFYVKLAGKSVMESSRLLSAKEIQQMLPGFNANGLKGGVLYWDGWTNDAQLTIRVIREAAERGLTALNYCPVTGIEESENGCVVHYRDAVSGMEGALNASAVINASGVWTDRILGLQDETHREKIKPSKGVHVVVRGNRIPSDYVAIVSSAAGDGRFLYSFPWEHGITVLGTTDTEYSGSADQVRAEPEDVDYILNAFNKAFPEANLKREDVVSVYAGLRPMLDEDGDKGSYQRSREYQLWWSSPHMLNIAGGKLTSFLSMGEKCVEELLDKFKYLSSGTTKEKPLLSEKQRIDSIIGENPDLAEAVSNAYSLSKAELSFHCRFNFAQKPDDILQRRTALTYAMGEWDEQFIQEVARLMAKELNWSAERTIAEVEEFRAQWLLSHPDFTGKN